MNISFEVTATGLPVTLGFPIKHTENVTSTANFRVKRAGAAIPAAFRVLSRWGGIPSDTTKNIKLVLVDFIPTATGAHTLEDTAGAVTLPTFTITDGASDIRIQNATIDARVNKATGGNDLLTQFVLNGVEQLAAGSKPRISSPGGASIYSLVVAADGSNNDGVGAAAGQNQVRVQNASVFSVGDTVKFEWKSKFVGWTNGGITFSATDSYGGWFQTETSPLREIILARGTAREFILPTFDYFFNSQIIGNMAGYSSQLNAIQVDDTVEDRQALLEPEHTITAIAGNVLTLDSNLTYQQMVFSKMVSTSAAQPTADFEIDMAMIEEQNTLRCVIKQMGHLEASGINPFPFLKIAIRWYFYADESFARVRMRLINNTTNAAQDVPAAVLPELKITFPTASAATASNDEVLTHVGTGSASARIAANLNTSVAVAGDFKLAVAEFAENFPSRLVGQASELVYSPFPAIAGQSHVFFDDWAKTWEFFIGGSAEQGLPLVNSVNAKFDAAYACDSKVFRHQLVPAKTWQAGDFSGNATLAEAANRAERLLACIYNIDACSTQGELGVTPRATLFEHRLSTHLGYGGNHNKGQHFGWQYFGNTKEAGTDGYTYNRYDLVMALFVGWLRTGDARAFRLGTEHGRFMADGGLIQSDIHHNGNAAYNYKGLNRYERSGSSYPGGLQSPRPTHSWSEGLWLHWAITGDPISLESALLANERAKAWNYTTVDDGFLPFNEARGHGWAAFDCFHGWRYLGDAQSLARCAQYLNILRTAEVSQGNKGVYVAPGYEITSSSGTQPYVWAGYPDVALLEYIREKEFQGTPDTALKDFLIRQAKWIARGDANLSQPGTNKPMVGNVVNGSNITPIGTVNNWYPGGNTSAETGNVALADLIALTLIGGARYGLRADLRSLADTVFTHVSFYRDAPDGARPTSQRTPISFLNGQFTQSSAKVYGQTAQALADYLPDAAANLGLDPPIVTSFSPTTIYQGQDWQVEINGSNFDPDAIVGFGGDNIVPDSIIDTQIIVTIPAGSVVGTSQPLVVINGNGGQSQAFTMAIDDPLAPTLTSINPATAEQGGPDLEIFVNGANFQDGAVVRWNGSTNLQTTFVDAQNLTAIIPANLLNTTGTAQLSIRNPDNQTTSNYQFQVTNPEPTISSLVPDTTTPGSASFTMGVIGTGFNSNSVVRWNGSALITVYSTPTQLLAQVPANLVASAGTANVTVFNPTPGGGESAPEVFTIASGGGASAPVISSINPTTKTAGEAQFTLTVNGSNFVNGAVVKVNGSNRTTTFVNAGQLTATIPASDIVSAGTLAITVQNPDNQTSGAATLTVNAAQAPAPSISSISPTTKTAGEAQFTLTVNGANFVNGAVVRVGGSNRTTTFVNAGQLTATIPASDIASAGSRVITVQNPDTQVSGNATLTVNAPAGAPVLTSLTPAAVNPGAQQFVLAVYGSGFVSGATVRVNGTNRATTFINAGQLSATIPASDVVSIANLSITVLNPDTQVSNAVVLPVGQVSTGQPILSPTMRATRTVLTAIQGSTFEKALNVQRDGVSLDLTGVTARLQVRRSFADEAYQSEAPLLTMTTENGGITVEPLLGKLVLRLTASQTDALRSFTRALFELKASDGTNVVTLLEGEFRVKKTIVR
jgi:hypothetical protein